MTDSIGLPEKQKDLECDPCNPGYILETVDSHQECIACKDGYYQDDDTCEPCEAGSYAPEVILHRVWTSMPENFENFCLTNIGLRCENHKAWI